MGMGGALPPQHVAPQMGGNLPPMMGHPMFRHRPFNFFGPGHP